MSQCIAGLIVLGCVAQEVSGQIGPLNHDTPAYIELEKTEVRGYEGSRLTLRVFRTGEYRWMTRVDYALVGGTAEEGTDFKGAGGTIVFQPGEGMKTVTVDLMTDDVTEAVESFALKLTANDEQTVVVQEGVILRVDDPPALRIAHADGSVTLTWEGSPDLAVERTNRPESGLWEKVSCPVQIDGQSCSVREGCVSGAFFYRLRAP